MCVRAFSATDHKLGLSWSLDRANSPKDLLVDLGKAVRTYLRSWAARSHIGHDRCKTQRSKETRLQHCLRGEPLKIFALAITQRYSI